MLGIINRVFIFSIHFYIASFVIERFCLAQNLSNLDLNTSYVPTDIQDKIHNLTKGTASIPLKSNEAIKFNINTSYNPSYIESIHVPCEKAKLTAVRLVIKKNDWGSGVIINRIENKKEDGKIEFKYHVITNQHVVKKNKNITLITSDQNLHNGIVNTSVKFEQDDLAIVEFSSPKKYAVASVGDYELSEDETVFATGFPNRLAKIDNPEFECLVSKVGLVMDEARTFDGGYRVGYDSNVVGGMSGGGVFDELGKLVAINGRPRNVRVFNPNTYKYGYKYGKRIPCRPIEDASLKLSWGIPITTVLDKTDQAIGKIASQRNTDIYRYSSLQKTDPSSKSYKDNALRIKDLHYCQIFNSK